jgi:hypothetical protein
LFVGQAGGEYVESAVPSMMSRLVNVVLAVLEQDGADAGVQRRWFGTTPTM